MKARKPHLEDIYQSQDQNADQETRPPVRLAEYIQRSLRRQALINLLTGSLTILLTLALAFLIIKTYSVSPERRRGDTLRLLDYAPAYTLPPEDRWVLDYRQAATELDSAHLPQKAPLSVRWVMHAAYHLVSAEVALQVARPAEARVHLQNALRIFPEMTEVHRVLGAALLQQEQFSAAVPVLQQALQEDRSMEVLVNLGAALLNSNQAEEAETMFLAALQEPFAPAAIRKNLALLYKESGQTSQAINQFSLYTAAAPDDLDALRMYNSFLIGLGRPAEALKMLEQHPARHTLPIVLLLARTAADSLSLIHI